MKKLLDTTEHHYPAEVAMKMVLELNADEDDGWTYAAVFDHNTVNYYYVAAYDEEGNFVAKF